MTKLPELEAEAARLSLGKQAGHRRLTPAEIAAMVKSGGQIAHEVGVPKAATGAVNLVVEAGAQIATSFQQSRATQIDPAAYRALVDQIDAFVTAFTDGLKVLARKRPVVVVLNGSGPWLREVMRRSGRRAPAAPPAAPARRSPRWGRPDRGPLFLADRRPVPARRPGPEHICPHTGRPRLGYDRVRVLMEAHLGLDPHQLRHSAATHLGEAKVPLQLIMAKTRHKNPRTAMRYTRPGGEAVAEVTAVLAPPRRTH